MNEYEFVIDKRIYNTYKKIETGMIALLKEKSYADINVKEICAASGVSRGTFYKHYKDKDDFLYQYQKKKMRLGKKVMLKGNIEKRLQFFEKILNFWQEEAELLLLLLGDVGAFITHNAIKKNLQANIEVQLIPILDTNLLTNKEKYFMLIFLSNAIFSVIQDWVQRGRIESSQEIATIIDKIINTVFIKE